jgi:antitoxin component of MazEF toxin-antitoxin module
MERLIITRIIKTGNSLCVVLPKNILHALKLERGDQVVFGILDDQSLVIHKLSQSDLLKLKQR